MDSYRGTASRRPRGQSVRRPFDVACSSASSCTAVGTADGSGLLVTGSGTSWVATEAPGNNGNALLASVACPSSSLSCVAAGYYGDLNVAEPLLVTGSGTTWTGVDVPLPVDANPGIGLEAAVCGSPLSCVAVGFYDFPDSEGLLLTGPG